MERWSGGSGDRGEVVNGGRCEREGGMEWEVGIFGEWESVLPRRHGLARQRKSEVSGPIPAMLGRLRLQKTKGGHG